MSGGEGHLRTADFNGVKRVPYFKGIGPNPLDQ
jgi:hypothetical protein